MSVRFSLLETASFWKLYGVKRLTAGPFRDTLGVISGANETHHVILGADEPWRIQDFGQGSQQSFDPRGLGAQTLVKIEFFFPFYCLKTA